MKCSLGPLTAECPDFPRPHTSELHIPLLYQPIPPQHADIRLPPVCLGQVGKVKGRWSSLYEIRMPLMSPHMARMDVYLHVYIQSPF